jgi:hypothetical protein
LVVCIIGDLNVVPCSVKEEFVRETGSQKYGIKRDGKRNNTVKKEERKNDRKKEEMKRVKETGAQTQRKQGRRYKGKWKREKDGNICSTEKINERKDGIENKNKESR